MICDNCKTILEYEVHPNKGKRKNWCGETHCFNKPNPSGLCDYHYRRWQNRPWKRLARWWRRKEDVQVEPKAVSLFTEEEIRYR